MGAKQRTGRRTQTPRWTASGASDRGLTSAVVQLPAAEFYHLGTSRQLIEATSALENRQRAQGGSGGVLPHPDQHVQNCAIGVPLRRPENHTLWVENATIPATWTLAHEHVLTNVPPNDWTLRLEPGVCLDFAPMGGERWCVRPYGFDDAFKGSIGAPETSWLGSSAADWFARRGIEMEDAACDLQQAALFPEVEKAALTGDSSSG